MPIIGWIRDLFGIQKDMYETKKTRLEIEKIEDEKREKFITPATLADVKKYDPKYQTLRDRVQEEDNRLGGGRAYLRYTYHDTSARYPKWKLALIIVLCVAASILIATLIKNLLPRFLGWPW